MATLASNLLNGQTSIDSNSVHEENYIEQKLQKLLDRHATEISKTPKIPKNSANEIDDLIPKFEDSWKKVKEEIKLLKGGSNDNEKLKKENAGLKEEKDKLKKEWQDKYEKLEKEWKDKYEKLDKEWKDKDEELGEENTLLIGFLQKRILLLAERLQVLGTTPVKSFMIESSD